MVGRAEAKELFAVETKACSVGTQEEHSGRLSSEVFDGSESQVRHAIARCDRRPFSEAIRSWRATFVAGRIQDRPMGAWNCLSLHADRIFAVVHGRRLRWSCPAWSAMAESENFQVVLVSGVVVLSWCPAQARVALLVAQCTLSKLGSPLTMA